MTRRSYRLLAYVVTLVLIYAVNAAGWLSDVTLVEGLLWAPVCFFGTAFFILGLERVLGITESDT